MRLSTPARSDLHRFLLLALPFLVTTAANATTYYVSGSGNDANTGTSQAQAWRTIERVNQLAFNFQAGDQILFQRGGIYPGELHVVASGTTSQPIVVGAYGSGDRPVISGSMEVDTWTNYQGNIWVAPLAQTPKYLFVGGQLMTLARYPNTGWLRNEQGSSTTLYDDALTQPDDYWNGARLVLRTSNWGYHTPTVTDFSSGTLTYTTTGRNIAAWHWGYFLCNKLSQLDQAGEWYYDDATDQLYLWAPGNADPNGLQVEAAVRPLGFNIGWDKHHITVQGVEFRHFTDVAIRVDGNDHLFITDCVFQKCWNAIRGGGGDNTYSYNIFQQTYGTAAFLMDNNVLFEHNTLTDIAMVPGLGEEGWGYFGIRTTGTGDIIRDNHLTNIGYIGIAAVQNALIEKNVIESPLAILNDGSGIAFDNSNGMIIRDNIVKNVVGDLGSSAANSPWYEQMGHGIYFGNTSLQNTLIQRNTVTNCSGHGIHMDHTMVTTGNQITDNVLFGNHIQICLSDISNATGPGATPPYYMPSYNDVITGNVFYCTTQDQLCMRIYNLYGATPVDFGTLDDNYYFNPYNEVNIFYFNLFNGVQAHFTLEEWQAERNEDLNSTRSPKHLNGFEATDVLTGNLIPSGDFDYDVNGWDGWPSNATVTHDYTYLDDGALKAHLPDASLYADLFVNGPDEFAIENGEWYRMRFSIQSNVLGQLNTRIKGLTEMSGPYATYERLIPFSGERRDVEFFFESDLTDQGLVQLVNHYTDPTYWIDNIELHHVQVATIDPVEHQVLLVNEQATTQTFPLTGCWSDVNGALFSGSVDLPAFSSKVLAKEEDAICGLTTGIDALDNTATTGELLYPCPVRAGSEVFMTTGGNGPAILELREVNGRVVVRSQAASPNASWRIPMGIAPGVYMARIQTPGSLHLQRLVVQ